jgi:hypothetical protein
MSFIFNFSKRLSLKFVTNSEKSSYQNNLPNFSLAVHSHHSVNLQKFSILFFSMKEKLNSFSLIDISSILEVFLLNHLKIGNQNSQVS